MKLLTLKTILKGDVEAGAATLEKYSHDASLFEVVPEVVIFPKDSEDVKSLVRWVKENGGSITARAAGTCMSGGPLNDSIILDFTKYMNRLMQVNFEEKSLIAEPGVMYRDFEKRAAGEGLMYPAFPASKDICAMGGIVGNNGAGEKTLRYGKAEKYVIQTKVVFSDGNEYIVRPLNRAELEEKMAQGDFEGNLYKSLFDLIQKNYDALQSAKPKVSKNSAGYYLWNVWDKEKETFDLNKLIVGSQGTLGIVTEAKFQLVDIEPYEAMLAIFMHDRTPLANMVNDALKLQPESIEAYDDKTIKLAMKFWTGFIKRKGLFGAIKLGLSFVPELWNMLQKGVPSLVLLVNFTGKEEGEVVQKVHDLKEVLSKYQNLELREALTKQAGEKYWTIRRDAFALLREHYQGHRTAPFIDDLIVPPEAFPEFLPKLQKILDDANLIYNIHGHAGNGNFHIIPLLDMHDAKNKDLILGLADKVYDLVLSYGGSITAEHNDGIVRTPYLEKMYGPFIMGLFKFTKTLFDPNNIFNPGKKVGDTKDYLRDHIRIEK